MILRAIALALFACLATPALAQKPPKAPAPKTQAVKPAAPAPVAIIDGDYTLGSPRAKILLVEYGAPTCPACKQWHDEIYVRLKHDYIDTGKIRFAFRELPSHNPPVDAAIFGIARCAGREKFFFVLDEAFRRQAEIERASGSPAGPGQVIADLAIRAGVADEKLGDCLDGPALTARLDAVQGLAIRDKVEATPTLVLDGRTLEDGYDDYEQLRARLDKAIAAAR